MFFSTHLFGSRELLAKGARTSPLSVSGVKMSSSASLIITKCASSADVVSHTHTHTDARCGGATQPVSCRWDVEGLLCRLFNRCCVCSCVWAKGVKRYKTKGVRTASFLNMFQYIFLKWSVCVCGGGIMAERLRGGCVFLSRFAPHADIFELLT